MSRAEIVNPVPLDEAVDFYRSMLTTFLEDPSDIPDWRDSFARAWEPERVWAARADGRWVATLRTIPRTLTIPGAGTDTREVLADALTHVTVAATHRRQGVLTTMLSASLEQAKHRGDPVSILIAAEWPIYGRFGYAPASQGANYTFRTRARGSGLTQAPTGMARQVDAAELGKIAPSVFDQARRLRAGQIDRPYHWWQRNLRLTEAEPAWKDEKEPVYIVHEGDSGPDGFLSWTPTRNYDETRSEFAAIKVGDLIAASDQGYLGLWQYLAGIDLVDEVRMQTRPVDEPVQWLLNNARTLSQTYRGDWLWVRLLDVPAALSARRYAMDGEVVIDVVDDEIGRYAQGRFVVSGGPEHADCRPAPDRPADLRVSQRALAATYLGGHSLRSVAIAGWAEEITPGAIRKFDAMLATPLSPWLATNF